METKKKTASKKAVKTTVRKPAVKASGKTKSVASKKTAVKTTKTKKVIKKVSKPKSVAAIKRDHKETKVSHKRFPRQESGMKRCAYKAIALFLGLLIAVAVHLFLELVYLKNTQAGGLVPNQFLGVTTFLPVWSSTFLMLAGLAFGFWLGSWGWRVVYVERRHRMFKRV